MRAPLAGLAVALLLAACGLQPQPMEESEAVVTLSEPRASYAAGEAIRLEVIVFNPDDRPLDPGTGLLSGARLELVSADTAASLPPADAPDRTRPAVISARQRQSFDLDVAALFPDLARPGRYRLTVVYPRFRSNTVLLTVLPAYRPDVAHRAVVETGQGTFTLRFFPQVAPGHVQNFVNLARSGFYDGTIFHRIIPGLVIQAGDPTGSGRGGPGYTIPAEFNDRPHVAGTLSMARGEGPDSAGSQWFICLDQVPAWDGGYTVFGEVEDGMDVVRAIGRSPVENERPEQLIPIVKVQIEEIGTADPVAR